MSYIYYTYRLVSNDDIGTISCILCVCIIPLAIHIWQNDYRKSFQTNFTLCLLQLTISQPKNTLALAPTIIIIIIITVNFIGRIVVASDDDDETWSSDHNDVSIESPCLLLPRGCASNRHRGTKDRKGICALPFEYYIALVACGTEVFFRTFCASSIFMKKDEASKQWK